MKSEPQQTAKFAPAYIGKAAPPISIGLPVYNGERYLQRCLRSVVSQSMTDFELVIADNCSTDSTEEICRELARQDPRVRYLRRDRNVGLIQNHNRLVWETNGELMAYVAADDEYCPLRLERLAQSLGSSPNAILAFSDVTEIDEKGAAIGSWHNECRTDHPVPGVRLYELYAKPHYAYQFFGLIRKKVLIRTMLHSPLLCGDRILLAELALNGPFVAVPEELLLHRTHRQQTNRNVDTREYYKANSTRPVRIVLPNV
ncbi:MAG TPA: glycosyltransferase family 2 protein, partial [Gammaproteobacteria bacterium]|nr:glycosyltransferase family 2 protein [Gammaproteobacteria bacterium]